ncbi:MAG: hypothetical protein E7311_00285 [Clostridiales bacterium]|nr:hypothetical protein [Clostridiales bacterium]
MNIGIDIDDTIANTQEFKLAYGVEYSMKKFNKIKNINANKEYAMDIFEWDMETEKDFFDEYFTNKMIHIQPKILAKDVINKLKDEGHNIYFITARNDNLIKDSLDITKKWLDKNEIKYDEVYANTGEKEEVCKKLKIDLIIDNSFSICKKASNNGINALLFHSLNNENTQIEDNLIKRVYSWPEIYYHIQNMI